MTASGRFVVIFAGLLAVWYELSQIFYVTDEVNYYLISQKISKINKLPKKVWKTYEALLVV